MFRQSFSSPLQRVVPYILVHDQRSIFQDRIKISHTNSVYIYPHKRNLDALLKVGVNIKVLVFRTLCCVVARIALATDCCCCWSSRSAPRRERGWMLSETSEKRAKRYILSGTLQLFLGSWCMERLIKKNLARHYSQIGAIFVPKLIIFTVTKTPTVLWYVS